MARGVGAIGTLTCRDVTVVADRGAIVDGVDITVEHGSCCVVMGRSGAGKSTLLKAVAGLVPYTGSITVGDRGLDDVPPHRRHVGMLFQEARLFPTMSALDNVAYPLRVRRMDRHTRRERAGVLLDRVGLGDRGAARPAELSGGERQRVALARALCSEPAVLLLDEPFTGLDVPQRRGLVDLLVSLRPERTATWVVVSHDPDDALRLGDTVAVLDRGALVQHARVDEVRARPNGPVVAALLANANVLVGHVTDACLSLGDVRIPWHAPDGATTLTVRPERARLGGGRRTDGAITLTMTVTAVHQRSTGPVVVLDGAAGHLEVPCHDRTPQVDERVTVEVEVADLWRLDR